MKSNMSFKEFFDGIAFMPARSVYIQPKGLAAQSFVQMSQDGQKTVTISLWSSEQSLLPQQGGHPTKHIQSFAVLTGGGNSQALSNLCPISSHLRMKSKPAFILEDNGLTRPQRLEFFLSDDGTSLRLPHEPEDRHGWPASSDNPTDASSAGRGAPLRRSQTFSSNEPPGSDHPSEPGINHSPSAFSPDEPLNFFEPSCSVGRAFRAEVVLSAPRPHFDLQSEPNDSNSFESVREHRLSIPTVAPPVAAISLRSLSQPRPQEFPRPNAKVQLASLRGASA